DQRLARGGIEPGLQVGVAVEAQDRDEILLHPGLEAKYLRWDQTVAAAQSKAPGLPGYRFEPAVPGVQEDFVAILRFDRDIL
ncbi:antibiotic biosynthesis monooxygenase, partial [Methylobacterium sp. J-048]|nr:antibiotic biosynthesis monooxygenase [Methylobacterium sp. J-048]